MFENGELTTVFPIGKISAASDGIWVDIPYREYV